MTWQKEPAKQPAGAGCPFESMLVDSPQLSHLVVSRLWERRQL